MTLPIVRESPANPAAEIAITNHAVGRYRDRIGTSFDMDADVRREMRRRIEKVDPKHLRKCHKKTAMLPQGDCMFVVQEFRVKTVLLRRPKRDIETQD